MPSLEQQRRAGGAAMAARRRGQATVDDINSLVKLPATKSKLAPIEPRGGLAAKQGRGDYMEPRPGGTAAGVAWPLTEQNYSQRVYWPKGEASSDGLFFFPAIRTLVLTDADGRTGSVNLAEPPEIGP